MSDKISYDSFIDVLYKLTDENAWFLDSYSNHLAKDRSSDKFSQLMTKTVDMLGQTEHPTGDAIETMTSAFCNSMRDSELKAIDHFLPMVVAYSSLAWYVKGTYDKNKFLTEPLMNPFNNSSDYSCLQKLMNGFNELRLDEKILAKDFVKSYGAISERDNVPSLYSQFADFAFKLGSGQ